MNHERAMIKRDEPISLSPALEHLAESIAKSTLIPQEFRNSPSNCLIALEMAHRIGAGVLQVMQSLYIVHGKPSWSGQFIIGAVNSTRRFAHELRFDLDEAMTECVAWTTDRAGNVVKGPKVTVEMAKKEGWWDRNPKWRNMTELMLRYRAGTFFGRMYCPDILMGMREEYELVEAEATLIKEPQIPTSTTTKDMLHEATVGDGGTIAEPVESPVVSPPVPKEEAPQPPKKGAKKKSSASSARGAAQSSPTTSKLTLKQTSPSKPQPNREALAERLKIGGFTEAQFVALCNEQEWLGKGRVWGSLDELNNDDMLAVFLSDEEWYVVQQQLEAANATIPD